MAGCARADPRDSGVASSSSFSRALGGLVMAADSVPRPEWMLTFSEINSGGTGGGATEANAQACQAWPHVWLDTPAHAKRSQAQNSYIQTERRARAHGLYSVLTSQCRIQTTQSCGGQGGRGVEGRGARVMAVAGSEPPRTGPQPIFNPRPRNWRARRKSPAEHQRRSFPHGRWGGRPW